jgi:hypothetical protein
MRLGGRSRPSGQAHSGPGSTRGRAPYR